LPSIIFFYFHFIAADVGTSRHWLFAARYSFLLPLSPPPLALYNSFFARIFDQPRFCRHSRPDIRRQARFRCHSAAEFEPPATPLSPVSLAGRLRHAAVFAAFFINERCACRRRRRRHVF